MQVLGNTRVLDEYHLSLGKDVPLVLVFAWLQQLRHWNQAEPLPGARPLSAGAVYLVDSSLGPVVLKRKVETGLKAVLVTSQLRESQLQRSFRLGMKAFEAGLHTPEPLLYAERRVEGGVETLLINRFDEGVQPWSLLGQRWLATAMLQSLGQELANWHASGLRHRDLKGPNLLYQPGSGTSILLDLAGVYEHGSQLSQRLRARDLARLRSGALSAGIQPEQWQCLLDAYLGQSARRGLALPDAPDFTGSIERYVRRKLARNQRRNRPVY
jgi:tRNA A-37 threonylcarbamoyl transferase component Bud32